MPFNGSNKIFHKKPGPDNLERVAIWIVKIHNCAVWSVMVFGNFNSKAYESCEKSANVVYLQPKYSTLSRYFRTTGRRRVEADLDAVI